MNEMNELLNRYNDLISNYSDLSAVGYKELDELWKNLDDLNREAASAAEKYLVGVTREPNGRFKSRDNIEFDTREVAKFFSMNDTLSDNLYNEMARVKMASIQKHNEFKERFVQRNQISEQIRQNQRMISTLESEINSIRMELNVPTPEAIAELQRQGIIYTPSESRLSPEKRFYLEQLMEAKINSLESFKLYTEERRNSYQKLTDEMTIIRNGGILEEPKSLSETDEKSVHKEPEEPKLDDGKDINTPAKEDQKVNEGEKSKDSSANSNGDTTTGGGSTSGEETKDRLIDPPEMPTIGEDAKEDDNNKDDDKDKDEEKEKDKDQDITMINPTPGPPTQVNVPEEEKPEMPKNVVNKPKVTWKTVAAVAAGVGLGAAVFFTAGPLGVGIMSAASTIAKKFINKKRRELAALNKLGMPTPVDMVVEPRKGIAGAFDKFKNYLKSEEGLRDMNWMLNSAIITGVGLSVGSAIHNAIEASSNVPTTPNPQPTATEMTTPAPEPVISEPTVATSEPVLPTETINYDGITLGESVGDYNVSIGHDSAHMAVNNLNPETLASQYVNESSIFNRFASINPDGSVGKIIDTHGLSITDFCAQNNLDISQIAVDVANSNGASQAWVNASELVSGMGGPTI